MVLATARKPAQINSVYQRASFGVVPQVLSDIHHNNINIAIWQRALDPALSHAAKQLIQAKPRLRKAIIATPANVDALICLQLGELAEARPLRADIVKLATLFCNVLALDQVNIKLKVLDQTMCPKFHVDQVPCRLITSYQGLGTEWLPDSAADRRKLGLGSQGKPDHASGLFTDANLIQQLQLGHVALMKGEQWQGNISAGLIHRSPLVQGKERRLLLVLDAVRNHQS